ncbi:uncharacterized protein LOC142164957 [Nicotiana tabacum]|uniref:Uncharacterized protein LOC142164957 n=1 Tax=Nicotiana tabacum TaxID=4097 RepID=A0AC58S445_TOBAC
MMNPLPSMNTVYIILLADEKQSIVLSASQFNNNYASFNARVSKQNFPSKVNFDSVKPQNSHSRFNSESQKSSLTCKYCKKPGHAIDKCYKLHGFLPNFKFTKGLGPRKVYSHVEVDHFGDVGIHNGTVGQPESPQASVVPYLTKDQYSQLIMLLQQSHISIPSSPPTLMASANFGGTFLPENGSIRTCLLTKIDNVIWIIHHGASNHMASDKSLLFNIQILSIPYLVSLPNGYKVKVHNVGSFALFPDLILHNGPSPKKPVVLGRHDSGLYNVPGSSTNLSLSSAEVSDDHVSDLGTKLSSKQSFICPICLLARKSRLPFPDSSIQSTTSFKLLHIGTWGPYHTTTYFGSKYFLTIVDDHSGATWTHFLGAKSNAFDILKAFIAMVETQFHTKVQTVRSDNALELGSSLSGCQFFAEKAYVPFPFLYVLMIPFSIATSSPYVSPTPTFSTPTPTTPASSPPAPSSNSPHPFSQPSASISPPLVPLFPSNSSSPLALRRYSNVHKQPKYLKSYVCQSISSTSESSSSLVKQHVSEPSSYSQVYKVKYKADGSIERYKARLVVRGDTQLEGINFHETRSPVVKISTIKTLIAVVVKKNWPLFQLDINNDFLNGDLDEGVYMKVPPGLSIPSTSSSTPLIFKLKKSLYGLRHASKQWYAKLSQALQSRGYTHALNDYSLFTKGSGDSLIILVVYVDDIVFIETDLGEVSALKAFFHDQFKIKYLGLFNYFIGIEVLYSSFEVLLHQRKFIHDLLKEFHCNVCSPVISPLELHEKLKAKVGDPFPNPEVYRSLVGKLNFLTHSRPDLSFAVQHLSQFMQHPYISLQVFCDSDWALALIIEYQPQVFAFLLGGSLVCWKSKKQHVVSLSSAEAEYRSLSKAVAEVTWLSRLLVNFGLPVYSSIPVFFGNQAALHIAKNPVFHERTKHIELDCHFFRSKLADRLIRLLDTSSASQVADIFTKSLPGNVHHFHLGKLGIVPPSNLKGVLGFIV